MTVLQRSVSWRIGPSFKVCAVVVEGGKRVGLKTWRLKAIVDAQGRFAPSSDETDEQLHPGSMIVEAIGQMTDASLLGDALTEQPAWQRGRLQVDGGGRTSEPWLWAAGCWRHGARARRGHRRRRRAPGGRQHSFNPDGWKNWQQKSKVTLTCWPL